MSSPKHVSGCLCVECVLSRNLSSSSSSQAPMLSHYLSLSATVTERLANHSPTKDQVIAGLLKVTNMTADEIVCLEAVFNRQGDDKRRGVYFDGHRDLAAAWNNQLDDDLKASGTLGGEKKKPKL